MKNLFKLLTLVLCLSTSFYLSAQISIGPKIGVNIASWGGDDAPDELMNTFGLQFGAAAEIGVNEMFAIQPELLFFQKGAETEIDFLGETIENKAVLNYFEIPILAKIMFGSGEGAQFFATAGPSFGFGLGGKSKVKVGGEEEEDDIDFDDSMLKKLDISLSVGAGAQFSAGPGNLFVDVRYLLGLTSLDDSEAEMDMKNRGIGIAAGFLFPIGGE